MISVIVPLYYGTKYMQNIVRSIERCSLHITQKIELIFINDSPQEKIVEVYSEKIIVIAQNLKKNMGIHGARKEGLKIATGQYILFLDQDDIIEDDYFCSQLDVIQRNDAVVCMATVRDNNAYENFETFVQSLSKEKMYLQNAIWSPGQVLIRKEAIPTKWIKENIDINGADDYFLWICMLHENKRFAYNREILFHHIIKGNINTSNNLVQMQQSVDEVIGKCCNNYLTSYECSILEEGNLKRRNIKLAELGTLRNVTYYLEIWMNLRDAGYNISKYLISHGIRQVSIYGMGKMGVHLYKEIRNDVLIKYLIDKHSFIFDNMATICPDDENINNKCIIVCILDRPREIISILENRNNKIIYLTDILDEMFAER